MIGWVLLLAACLVGGPAQAARLRWHRVWTVKRVVSVACDAADRRAFHKHVGMKLTIGPDRFINPADETCRTGVVYTDVRRRRAAYAYKTIPGMPKIGQRYIMAGVVGCAMASGPPNAIARVAFEGATGYYLFEGGVVFGLR
jgi:hypothetical protein